ncbi:MAG: hypothetical protein MAGBODY4_01653 [Candidatus Marinimicrobia bacterium]|nr:hypothetical protein [Candidatus Neomarinimicrobiota bacterium]
MVGPKNSGKTTYIRELIERAYSAGMQAAGFYATGEWVNGRKERFYLHEIASSSSPRLLASKIPNHNLDTGIGSYHLNSNLLDEMNSRLKESVSADIIFIDEFGPLEATERGYFPGVQYLLQHFTGKLVITTRPYLMGHVMSMVTEHQLVSF